MRKIKLLLLLLTILVALSLTIAYVAAQSSVGSITGHVTVKEPITISLTEFTVELYAGENVNTTITLTNKAKVEIPVEIIVSISPSAGGVTATAENGNPPLVADPLHPGTWITLVPAKLPKFGDGVAAFDVMVKAESGAAAGTFTVTVQIIRM